MHIAKALALNLDASIFGTLAEIGAGQEVARWFLRVGAASGTVAQTISAYDKVVSDAIYGAGTRYVSRERLLAMLDYEYRVLLERLNGSRGSNTCFFVFGRHHCRPELCGHVMSNMAGSAFDFNSSLNRNRAKSFCISTCATQPLSISNSL